MFYVSGAKLYFANRPEASKDAAPMQPDLEPSPDVESCLKLTLAGTCRSVGTGLLDPTMVKMSKDMFFDWADADLRPITLFLLEEARMQRFNPETFLPTLPVLDLLKEEADRYKRN